MDFFTRQTCKSIRNVKLKICEVTKNTNINPTMVNYNHTGPKSNDYDTFKHGDISNLNLKKVKKSLLIKKDSYLIPRADSSCLKAPLHNTNIKAKDERSVIL